MVPAGSALGVQSAVVFQGRGNTCSVEFLKNRCNAADGTFYDAIKIEL